MGQSDERKDSASSPESHLSGGKELLYGWLVGRAAADLGLAQALATSEAYHGEQIKRMEESLQAQIQELKDRHSFVDETCGISAEIDALKLEMGQIREWRQQVATEKIRVDQLETAIREKIGEFEGGDQQISESVSRGDFNDLKFELKILADRVARAEFSTQQAFEKVMQRVDDLKSSSKAVEPLADEQQGWGQMIEERLNARITELANELREELRGGGDARNEPPSLADEMAAFADRIARFEQAASVRAEDSRAEIGAIKNRLDELAGAAISDEHASNKIEKAISARIDPLYGKLSTALAVIETRDAEIKELHGQMSRLATEVSQLINRSDDPANREEERAEWSRGIEESISARMDELAHRLDETIDLLEKGRDDGERFQLEMKALANRLDQVELGHEQTRSVSNVGVEQVATALRAEIAALEAELRRHATETSQTLIQAVEGTLNAKMEELQNGFAREQQSGQSREALLRELHEEIQKLAQRLAHAESSAQQTPALMVNEAAQSEQLREGVTRELAALESRLAHWQADGVKIDSLAEQLNARFLDAESQWSQKWASLANRDAEIAEIKMQVQNLIGMTAAKNAAQPLAPNRTYSPIGVTVGLSGSKSPPEAIPVVKSVPAASEPSSLLRTYDSANDGSKDQKKQLQQRISADIERVRAELRKRAGMSR